MTRLAQFWLKTDIRFAAVFLVALICGLMPAVSNAQQRPHEMDLSALPWKYRIGDPSAGETPPDDFSNWKPIVLPGPLPESLPWNSDRIFWLGTEITAQNRLAVADHVLLLGRIHDYDQTYVNGTRIGETGRIIHNMGDFVGLGPAQVARAYVVPAELLADDGVVRIAIRIQSLNYQPGIIDGPMLLGEPVSMVRLAHELDRPIEWRDGLWFAVLFASVLLSAISLYSAGRDSRNFWLPFAMGSVALAVFPYSIHGFHLGFAQPLYSMLSDLTPYFLFACLHIATSTGIGMGRFLWVFFGLFYSVTVAIYAFRVSIPVYVVMQTVFYLLALAVIAILGIRIARNRRDLDVSRWAVAGVAVIFISIGLTILFGGEIPAVWDPLNIGLLIAVGCFVLAMTEDHRKDRILLAQKTGEVLVAQDQERSRIARELHDGINQRLSVTRFRLERLRGRENRKADRLDAPIDELRQTAREVSVLVEGLRSVDHDRLSFADVLKSSINRWDEMSEKKIALSLIGHREPAGESRENLFRIVQEAVHNALRHSNCRSIDICADLIGKTGRIEIIDDGEGFEVSQKKSGLGLIAMRERAGLANVRLEMASEPGQGTTVRLEFPIS